MKKILLMSFEYPTGKCYCGGVGQVVKQCREALKGMGHEVYVLIAREFEKKHPVSLLSPDDSLKGYKDFWRFQREYDLGGFDAIIQHFVNWARDLKRLRGRNGARPRIIYHFHSILRREKDSGFKTFNRFMINQERMIRIADAIICPSLYEYDNFSRYYSSSAHKVTLIENTIETFPKDNGEIDRIRNRYDIRSNDMLSIYVGRLERIKGAHILLEKMPQILKRHSNHKIFIVGKALETDLYNRLICLRKRHPRQLFYMRYVEKRTLYQYYYLCHLYINTSLSESFSLSAHESAFCGNALLLNELPVFGKFKGAALFFSNRESTGNEFMRRYAELAKNATLRNRLSNRASRIAQEFSIQNRFQEKLSALLERY